MDRIAGILLCASLLLTAPAEAATRKKAEKSPAPVVLPTNTAPVFSAATKAEGHPLAAFWNDAEFVKRFMGEYGFVSELEPKLTNPEEIAFYKSLAPVIRENPSNAIAQIEAKLKPEASAVLNFTLGMLYFQNDQATNAARQFENAIAKFPDYRRAHKNLGFALVRLQRYEDAIKPLARTIELGGGDGNTFGLLGFCYLSLERHISAEAAYKNAMLFAPDNSDWKLGIVKAQIGQGRLKEAAEMLDEMLARNPANDSLWALQAGIYMQNEQLNKAAANYEFIRKLGKLNTQTLFLLGDIYVTQGARDLAVPVYLEAISKDEGKNVGRALRAAEALTIRGAWDEARKMFGQLRESHGARLSPEEDLKLLKLEAKVAMATGAGDEAIKTLERIVEKNPLEGEALLMIGDYYARKGEREKAEFRFDMASKINGFEAESYVKHAQMLVGQQKYDRALELLQMAQKVKPRDNVQRYLEAVQRVARARS